MGQFLSFVESGGGAGLGMLLVEYVFVARGLWLEQIACGRCVRILARFFGRMFLFSLNSQERPNTNLRESQQSEENGRENTGANK